MPPRAVLLGVETESRSEGAEDRAGAGNALPARFDGELAALLAGAATAVLVLIAALG